MCHVLDAEDRSRHHPMVVMGQQIEASLDAPQTMSKSNQICHVRKADIEVSLTGATDSAKASR